MHVSPQPLAKMRWLGPRERTARAESKAKAQTCGAQLPAGPQRRPVLLAESEDTEARRRCEQQTFFSALPVGLWPASLPLHERAPIGVIALGWGNVLVLMPVGLS